MRARPARTSARGGTAASALGLALAVTALLSACTPALRADGPPAPAPFLEPSAPPPSQVPPPGQAMERQPEALPRARDPHGLIRPALLEAALDAFHRHRDRLSHHDRIGIVDYSLPSTEPRFYILDLVTGGVRAYLTAHGVGSDRDHDGMMEAVSDVFGSGASPAGAFLTDDIYCGVNGKSLRLDGLDPDTANARVRAIVLHSTYMPGRTPYMSRAFIDSRGRPGRSCGCFVVLPEAVREVIEDLAEGRLIYAAADRPLPKAAPPYPPQCAELAPDPNQPPPDQSPDLCPWPGEPMPPREAAAPGGLPLRGAVAGR